MATVDLAAAEVAGHLDAWGISAEMAVENAPDLTVIADPPDEVLRAIERFAAEGAVARLVNVDFASHSASVDPVLGDLAFAVADLTPQPGGIPMFSTVTGTAVEGPELDAGYWARNLRQPVRFASVIADLAERGYDTFVEISPHPILTSAMAGCAAGALVLPTLRRAQPERRKHA